MNSFLQLNEWSLSHKCINVASQMFSHHDANISMIIPVETIIKHGQILQRVSFFQFSTKVLRYVKQSTARTIDFHQAAQAAGKKRKFYYASSAKQFSPDYCQQHQCRTYGPYVRVHPAFYVVHTIPYHTLKIPYFSKLTSWDNDNDYHNSILIWQFW